MSRDERIEQRVDVVRDHERLELAGLDEAPVDGVAHEGEEVVEEAVDIEDGARFVVNAELRPRHRLHELLVGAESARQHDECVGQLGHQGLALVHGAHHVQIAERLVGDLVAGQ